MASPPQVLRVVLKSTLFFASASLRVSFIEAKDNCSRLFSSCWKEHKISRRESQYAKDWQSRGEPQSCGQNLLVIDIVLQPQFASGLPDPCDGSAIQHSSSKSSSSNLVLEVCAWDSLSTAPSVTS
eukprot:765269-Hanusia_phi.AAC.7